MSAKSAAVALLRCDPDLAAFAATLDGLSYSQRHDLVITFIRTRIMHTWTLSLAAESAMCAEEQVVAALLYLEPLHMGSSVVCRGLARNLYEGNA